MTGWKEEEDQQGLPVRGKPEDFCLVSCDSYSGKVAVGSLGCSLGGKCLGVCQKSTGWPLNSSQVASAQAQRP